MDWVTMGLIVVAGSQLGLGILVLLRNPNNKINISFFLVAISLFFWVLFTAQSRLATDLASAQLLFQLKFSFGLLIALFFQIFTLFFPYQKTKINFIAQFLILLPVFASILVVIFWPHYAIERISFAQYHNFILVNKIYWFLFSSSFTLCFAIAFIRLYKRWKEQGGFFKTQLQYVLFSALVPTVFAWFFNVIFFFFNEYSYDWLGAFLTFIFSFPLYYFIFYYQKN